jgi:hypothetical protein
LNSRRLSIVIGVVLLGVSLITLPRASSSPIVRSEILGPGETTYDGVLTLVVRKFINGQLDVSLRNNSVKFVTVDSYSPSGSYTGECKGQEVGIRSGVLLKLCSLSVEAVSRPSPQFTLNWHVARPKKTLELPTPDTFSQKLVHSRD